MQMWKNSAIPMTSTIGPMLATIATRIRPRRATFLTMSSDMKTWTTTATGGQIPLMETYGTRALMRAGLRIATGTGPGSIRGDGPGSMRNPGATLRFTMAAGCRLADVGDGFRDRWKFGRSMRLLSSCLWAEAAASAAIWDGSH